MATMWRLARFNISKCIKYSQKFCHAKINSYGVSNNWSFKSWNIHWKIKIVSINKSLYADFLLMGALTLQWHNFLSLSIHSAGSKQNIMIKCSWSIFRFHLSNLLLTKQTGAGWKYNAKHEYVKQSAHINTSPPYCSGQEALVPAHAKNNSHAGCLTPAHRLPALELQPASHMEAKRPVACLLMMMVLDKHQNKVWDGQNTTKLKKWYGLIWYLEIWRTQRRYVCW